MTDIIKEHMLSNFEKGVRFDGRKFDEYRKVSVEYGVSAKSAEGSAMVTIGDTVVVAGVKLEVGTPFPDTPDQGALMVNAELLPLSSPKFEAGPPSIYSIELSRVIDRAVRESHYVDFEKLCIKKAEKCWIVMIDIYPLNDAGNLWDAAALAALAALKDAKYPEFDGEKIDYSKKTKTSLPLTHMPISITVMKIGNKIIIDPTTAEEEVIDSRLTVGISEEGEVCSMQKGGNQGLTIEEIDTMVELVIKKAKELRSVFKK